MKKLWALLALLLATFWVGCGGDGNPAKATFLTFDNTTNVLQISVLSSDGKTSTKAPFTLTTDMIFINPSPDAKFVAYCKQTDSGFQVFIMGTDGKEKQLTTVGESCIPSFSSDGRKIVFESVRNGEVDQIYTMNADGTNQTRVFAQNTGFVDTFPQFSPDGKLIVFYRHDNGSTTTAPASAWRAMANQSRAALERNHHQMSRSATSGTASSTNQGIWTVKVGGTGALHVIPDASFDNAPAVFSADGKKLLFTSFSFGGNPQIASVKLDGTALTNLSNDTTKPDIAPLPLGNHILFNRFIDAQGSSYADIMQMDVNGANQVNLTNTATQDELLPGIWMLGF